MPTRTIEREEDMADIAEEIFSTLPQKDTAHVLALSGALGAGKTSFTKALARHLGIIEHITSPTFVIMKSYEVPSHEWVHTLTHVDAYRIEDVDEVRVLRLTDLFQEAGRIMCIEWPENIKELVPDDALTITIHIGDNDSRTITYGS